MMKSKIKKIKSKLHSNKKLLHAKLNKKIKKYNPLFKKISSLTKRNKKQLMAVGLILSVVSFWFLASSWLVLSSISQSKTYPNATTLGKNVGNLDDRQLEKQLANIKSIFETQKITLTSNQNKWTFDFGKLGIKFDEGSTAQKIKRFNELSVRDKYRLMMGDISSVVEPTILINKSDCVKSLSIIDIPEIKPADALFYFDKEVRVKPDQIGAKYNAVTTCEDLPKVLATNSFTVKAHMDNSLANITKRDLDVKLSEMKSMVSGPLELKNGGYKQTLTTDQLMSMIEVSKGASGVEVRWSEGKLDELVNNMAASVNTYDNGPALGGCQYLSSAGGDWLDKTATKNIFQNLKSNNARLYDLPVGYHAPVIGTIRPVAAGNSGPIYLTFDDGLAYGNQIMNYAACYGVKVTFFELGVLAYGDAAALRRAIAEGHAVQSHGYTHALFDYGQRSYDWQYNDISQSINAITSVTGVRPTYFRPPGGNRSSLTYSAAAANGINLILWGVSSGDGANIGSSATCSNVLARAFADATVLLHSSKADTAAAVPCIIEGLAARGYSMQAFR